MRELRNTLVTNKYDVLVREASGVGFFINPIPIPNEVKTRIHSWSEKNQILLSFFLLGNGVIIDDFIKYFGKKLVNELNDLDLIVSDEIFIKMKRFIIVVHQGLFLFTDKPYYYSSSLNDKNDIYIGADSYYLSNILTRERGKRALDLCTGTGIQALVLSDNFEKVDAVDINPTVIDVIKLNTLINNSKNVTLFISDIYKSLITDKYDLIVSNPPFIPFIREQDFYSIAGAAGLDGLDIINQILIGIPDFLNEKGRCIISGEGLSKEGRLLLMNSLEKYIPYGYKGNLIIKNEISIDTFLSNIKTFCDASYGAKANANYEEILKSNFSSNNIDKYHTFLLDVVKINSNKKSDIMVTKLYNTIDEQTKFDLQIDIKNLKFIENEKSFVLMYRGKAIATLDEEAKKIIESNCFLEDNNKNIELLKNLEACKIIKRRI